MGLFRKFCPFGCGKELGFCQCGRRPQGDKKLAKAKTVSNGKPKPRGKK